LNSKSLGQELTHLESVGTRGDYLIYKVKGKIASPRLRQEIGRTRELVLRKNGNTSGKNILWSDTADLESTHYLLIKETGEGDTIKREMVGVLSRFSDKPDAIKAKAILPEYASDQNLLDILP